MKQPKFDIVPEQGAYVENAFRMADGMLQVLLYNVGADHFSWYAVNDCKLILMNGEHAFFWPDGAPSHGDARPSLAVGFKKAA